MVPSARFTAWRLELDPCRSGSARAPRTAAAAPAHHTNPSSPSPQTFFLLEYASAYYDAAFVLKTDDDAFVNVQPLMAQLQALCEDPQCRNERLYLGHLARRSEVVLQPGHRWNNADFFIHTGALCLACVLRAGQGGAGWGGSGAAGAMSPRVRVAVSPGPSLLALADRSTGLCIPLPAGLRQYPNYMM